MDTYLKAILNDEVVVTLLDCTDLVSEALKLHNMSEIAADALARTLIAGAFITSEFKSNNTLSIIIDGNGGLGKIVVAGKNLEVRGYVENQNFFGDDLSKAVGSGEMTVIIDMGLKEPYIGKCELLTSRISEDFAYYFTASEQHPSAIAIDAQFITNSEGYATSVISAGGIFIQPLPQCNDYVITMLEDIATNFTNVSGIIKKMSLKNIVEKYFSAFNIKFFDVLAAKYKCSCSIERMEGIVKGLGRTEAEEIIKENNYIEINCRFCDTNYRINQQDLDRIFGGDNG